MKLVVCECAPVTDTLFLCHPVQLPDSELEAIYLGPKGVFAIVGESEVCDLANTQTFLRNFFGTPEIKIYHRGIGFYHFDQSKTEGILSEEELQAAIHVHTQERGFFLWHKDMLVRLTERVRHEDARNRGVFRDDAGTWFIARGQHFVPLSDKDPTHILRLTLFGGIFGLHRFALEKWGTGILYLLTGGLIGFGWFMDLIQLSFGAMKDKKKRLLSKPDLLSIPWYLAGVVCSFVFFCLYVLLTGILTGAIGLASQQMAENITPEQANALIRFLGRISGQ